MASVTYKINGKADNSAIDSAKKGLQSLGQVASGVQKIFTGFLAIKAVQMVSKGIGDTLSAYQTQQKAISQLTHAVSNNANLTSASLKRIIDYTGKLQGNSIFGDETLQGQATLLAGMQLTEDQIKNVLKAATELTSAGIGTLEGNVKNLSKQFGGMTGELGESLPALKRFSKEALMAGEGVAFVAKQYAGFAANLANNTLEGKQNKIGNLLSDIQEKIGALFAIGKISLFDNLEPLLIKINDYLATMLPKIASFFINLPTMASIAFDTVMQLAKRIFTIQFAFDLLKNLAGYIIDVFKATFETLFNIIYAISNTLVAPIKYAFDSLVYGVQLLFTNMFNGLMSGVEGVVNFILSGVNKLIGAINKVSTFLKQGDILSEIKDIKITATLPKPVDFRQDPVKSIGDGWKGVGTSLLSTVKTIGESYLTHTSAVGESLSPMLAEFVNKIEALIDTLPGWAKDIFAPAIGEAVSVSQSGSSDAGASASSGGGFSLFGGADMSPLSLLMDAISPLIDMFMSLSSLQMIMDPLMIVFKGIFSVLSPIIDSLLTPLIGIFTIIGQTIGKVFSPLLIALTPIIEIITNGFIFLYNYAIRPLANSIIWVVSTIYNMVANLVNAVVSALNHIPFVNIKWKMATMSYDSLKLDAITSKDVSSAGTTAVDSAASSTSASYTGPSTINIYINYTNSYVNGDAREIALNIRQEIQTAEAMGY